MSEMGYWDALRKVNGYHNPDNDRVIQIDQDEFELDEFILNCEINQDVYNPLVLLECDPDAKRFYITEIDDMGYRIEEIAAIY